MHEVLKDQDLLEEVMSKPDVYGITYGSSNQDVLDEIEKICKNNISKQIFIKDLDKETADVLKDIQKQFQELLDKPKTEGDSQTENKPVDEVVDAPSKGTDQAKNVVQSDEL